MALSDEIKREQEKLKGRGVKAHLSYFWYYYKIHTIAAVLMLLFIISAVRSVLSNKPAALNAVFLNAVTYDVGNYDALMEGFSRYADIDLKKNSVLLDMTEYMTPGGMVTEYDLAASQKIAVQENTGQLDLLVADAWNFRFLTLNGGIRNLTELFSEEELEKYAGKVYYIDLAEAETYAEQADSGEYDEVTQESLDEAAAGEKKDAFVLPDPSGMEEPVPVGIVVSDAAVIEELALYPDTVCILGYAGGGNTEKAKLFLEYLYGADGGNG